MQEMGNIGAESSHFRRRQVVALDTEGLRVLSERLDRKRDVVSMSQFIIRIHENDVFSCGVRKSQPFALFHVPAIIIQNKRVIFPGNFTGGILGMGVGNQDFITGGWVGLERNRSEAVFQK